MWRLLEQIGWSRQVPTGRGIESDEEVRSAWRAEVWPRVRDPRLGSGRDLVCRRIRNSPEPAGAADSPFDGARRDPRAEANANYRGW
ncbi:hypothetical protein AB0K14_34625 [Actinosynnema sp. NPDC050801]|uniref:hypothetical protein n=1 Tax=unclassified Actinosynnema TaxID=2637065 RepID=UPI0033D43CF4